MSEATNVFTDGEVYERLMGRWSRLVGKTFLDWLDIPKGSHWLDVGCGNGAFTEEIISRTAPAAVVAIDPSMEQIAYATKRAGTEIAKFQLGDAQMLPFDNDKFDVAVMALVISFLTDPAKAVAEMVRVVRPGGCVAAYMWDLPGGGVPTSPIYRAMRSMGITPASVPNPLASELEALKEIWVAAGLESVGLEVIRITVTYSDFDDFWNSNSVPGGPQGKVIHSMPAAAREQLRTRLRQQLSTRADGTIAYESVANAVKGRVPMPS